MTSSTRMYTSSPYLSSSLYSHSMPTSSGKSTYHSSYGSTYVPSVSTRSRPTDYSSTYVPSVSTRNRTTDYSSSYGTTSRTRTPSASRRRSSVSTYHTDYDGSTRTRTHITSPIDSGGRPLPKGPGTRDTYGNRVDEKEHLNGLRHTLHRNGSVSRDLPPRGPVRGDHSTYTSGSTYSNDSTSTRPGRERERDLSRLSKQKRTSSVADITRHYNDLSLTKKFGSNTDLSSTYTSPRNTSHIKVEELSSSRHGTKYSRSSSITTASPPLPDISITNKTSSVERELKKSDLDDLSPSSKRNYTRTRRDSVDSYKSEAHNHSQSDYTNNNKGLVGLKNVGNTCFMNSVLQCLSNTQPLLEYCSNEDYKNDINTNTSSMKGQLIKVFASVVKTIWKSGADSYITPSDFKSQIARFAKRFVGYNQQDAQEFLIYLLEGLHEDINRISRKKKRYIDDSNEVETISASDKARMWWNRYLDHDNSRMVELFVGQLHSALTCTVCGYVSNTFDPFWDLSLPIPKSKSVMDITDCLKLFTQEEILEGDEQPTCAQCKKRQRCTKKFSIQKFPKVLILHLKRFNQGSYYRSKLSTLVEFPMENLDLSRYTTDKRSTAMYNLYAVSNHSGSTGGGHYTAYAKNPYSSEWHHFNDQRVSSISKSRIVSSEAYVLFYELQGLPSHL